MIKLIGFVTVLSLLFTVDNRGYATIEFQPGATLSQVVAIVTHGENVHYKIDVPPQYIMAGGGMEISREKPITLETLQEESESYWRVLAASSELDKVDRGIPRCWKTHTCAEPVITQVTISNADSSIEGIQSPHVKSVSFASKAEVLNEAFLSFLRLMSGRPQGR